MYRAWDEMPRSQTMEANAALKTIVRRDTGESYRKMLLRMAEESGIGSPTDDGLARMDRKRVGKTLSNKDWQSQVDPEAKITKRKDGRMHLAHKPEHTVDLDTGAVVAVEVHEADKGDTPTLQKTLEAAQENVRRVTFTPPCPGDPAELVKSSFEHTRDRCGGVRRVWLRGRENIRKRYVPHVAGFNLGLLMRLKTGRGTPEGWANAYFALIWTDQHPFMVCLTIVILTEEQGCMIMPVAITCLKK